MKQIFLFFFITFSFSVCYAQLEKGTRLVQGALNGGFNARTEEFSLFPGSDDFESRHTYLTLAPGIGWFTGDQSLAGIGLTYQRNTSRNTSFFVGDQQSQMVSTQNLYSFHFFYTKYRPIIDKFYLTTTINFLAGGGTDKLENGGSERASNVFQLTLNIVPGVTYFLSERWALQASIGQAFYQYNQATQQSSNPERTNISHDFGLNFRANAFQVGFRYFLPAKEK